MKKLSVFVLFCVLAMPCLSWAGLNQDALMDNVLKRFQSLMAAQGGNADSLSAESIEIEKKVPFEVTLSGHNIELYAIKVALQDEASGMKQNVTLIVDSTGAIQLDGALVDLATGSSVHQEAMDELNRLDREMEVGDVLFQGQGEIDVLFLSDPFCPYCRHAYDYLIEQKGRINKFKIAHFPISPTSGAVALTLLMMEHKGEDNFQDVVEFAYTIDRGQLSGNADHSVIDIFNEQFQVFDDSPEDVFEYLQSKHQNKLAEEMSVMRDMGLTGTPLIIVDRVMVSGFNRDRIDKLLDKK
ncbi:DsbA family protein [Desulfonatronovibrio magnus]|uniref:DsbA family protein n=1 Tax=Desulfonatronovibrio magnus TaxID=698827 RepID=UPI0005EB266B|nr:hypothetical protein [Desulfonatronovibrio magnus]